MSVPMIGMGTIFDTSKASRSLWIILGVVLTLPASRAPAQSLKTAELTPATALSREADLPVALSPRDTLRYRHIFALQQTKRWPEADREIAQLGDPLLVGTALAERYRDRSYHASYAELVHGLERYSDQPEAKTIYALALQRRSKGAAAPTKPQVAPFASQADALEVEPRPTDFLRPRLLPDPAPAVMKRAQVLDAQIRGLAPKEPRLAELMLAGPEAKQLIEPRARDQLRAVIAEGYLARGKAQEALTMSATNETDSYAPIANWNAGLAAWRLARLDEARTRFQAVARSPGQSPWAKSAAAFWSARVELRAHRPENYAYWLRVAAENPRTFYGLIARRLLGVDHQLSFDPDRFTEADAQL